MKKNIHAPRWLHTLSLAFVCTVTSMATGAEPQETKPLRQAHSHNDYLHQRPLHDALEQGFCSVEADIWLVDGKLLVAHDRNDVRPGRTLQALYLDPLSERVKKNGGKVFPGGPDFTLLVDVKSDATNTYQALRLILQEYASMLTRFQPGLTESNAVTVIISGNRARALMAAETSRLAGYDGRLADLNAADSRHLIPLVSDNWTLHFKWRGKPEEGSLPDAERTRLKVMVSNAHARGQRLRLWGTPDAPAMWKELRDAGVDLINTDKLPELRSFLMPRQ